MILKMFIHLSLLFIVASTTMIPSARQVKDSATHLLTFSKGNDCIARAISNLQSSCEGLASTEKMLLALDLTNCLLKQAKKPTVECSPRQDLDECTSQLRGDGWTTFSNFFMHIDNLCYYYRSLIWQQKTSQLINGLSTTASQTQQMMSENLKHTKSAIIQQQRLSESLKQNMDSQKLLHIAMQENTVKLANMSTGITGSLSKIHSEIMSHYHSIQTVFQTVDTVLSQVLLLRDHVMPTATNKVEVYYIGLALIVIFTGMMEVYRGARDMCLIAICMNWLIERAIYLFSFQYFLSLFWLRAVFLACIVGIHYAKYYDHQRKDLRRYKEILSVTQNINKNLASARIRKIVQKVMIEKDKNRQRFGEIEEEDD